MLLHQPDELHALLALNEDAVRALRQARNVSLPMTMAEVVSPTEVEKKAVSIVREGKVERIRVHVDYDPTDPETLKSAAHFIEAVGKDLQGRAKSMEPTKPEPVFDVLRTGTGVTIGAVGGFGAGLILQELGKAGQTSGNPFLSVLSLGCTIAGAAIGAGVGAGFINLEASALGVTIKTGADDNDEEDS